MVTNLNLTDMETCYKVFRSERPAEDRPQVRPVRVRARDHDQGRQARAAGSTRCPISYAGRDYAEGKKIGWKDGLAAVWHIIRFRFFG